MEKDDLIININMEAQRERGKVILREKMENLPSFCP